MNDQVSRKLRPFGTTIFAEMTRLAMEHDAINLSQGFPDFDGPPLMIEAAGEILRACFDEHDFSKVEGLTILNT